ncbi:F-box domain-containing protein [Mycena venus]|uniref:F-box domain-containing protein n=1 Tax=Mycena venus TaxID=2733690 RepID=A0A8H6YHD3_9AGAR|nr:F-box domain-containing protein [Mycena venus]
MNRQNTNNPARRSAIEEELAVLCERMAVLKAEYNSIAPISVLPNEVLIQIFSCVPEFHSYSVSPVIQLHKLSLVCRDWHDIVLGSSALWSNITCPWQSTERKLEIQLTRSRAAPLTIKFDRLDSFSFAPMIPANAERLKSLDIAGEPKFVLDFMSRMQHFYFPLLQSLTLTPDHPLEGDGLEVEACLPLELLEGRMPRISRLSLSYIDAGWESLPPLRALILAGGPGSRVTPISFHVLFGLLQSSPALYTLQLDMMTVAGGPEQPHPVELPHLRLLYFRDFLHHCKALLAHLVLPPSTRLLLYPLGITGGVDVRDILIPLRKHLRAPGAPIATTLVLRVPLDDGTVINFRTTTYLNEAAYTGFDLDGLFGINSHPAGAPALRQIMAKVLKALPTQSITYLDIGSARLTYASWKTALALLPALEKVRLHVGDGGTHFCQAALDMGYSLCALRVLCTVRAGIQQEMEWVAPFFNALTRLLRGYQLSETPLKHLDVMDNFRALDLGAGKWAELRGLVGKLDTDVEQS